ncbi:MAG: hypothetical protein J6A59_05870 [Lachnospiraceae bacterium]|nr:hypothetical protein [Lachnospiraceae bacterium]MBO5407447.1 hypothetical protein [Bacteroidales bacterium]
MKRIFIVVTFFIISCSGNNIPNDKLIALDEHNIGKVISITEEDWSAQEKFGEMVKTYLYTITKKEYNEKGYIISETFYNNEGDITNKTKWEYISDTSYIKTKYNKEGKPIQEERVNHLNGIIQKIDRLYYTYIGDLFLESQYKEKEKYYYTGQMLDSIIFNKDNTKQIVRFEYIDNNGSYSVTSELYSGEIVKDTLYYNDKKQIIKRTFPDNYNTCYEPGKISFDYAAAHQGSVTEYEYDEHGNNIVCKDSRGINMTMVNKYDSNKNLIEQIIKGDSFGIILTKNYVYKQ